MRGEPSRVTVTESGRPPIEKVALILKALGDNKRLEVLQLLMQKPLSVGDLAERLELEVANLSYHLKILRSAGIVYPKASGQKRVYHLAGRTRLGTLYLKLSGGIEIKLPLREPVPKT